jgi:uncharacterized Fe-S cluster-containing radical SAM superfamily protein
MKVIPIGAIDTAAFSADLRRQIIDVDRKAIRFVRFQNTLQSTDLSVPWNCRGFGRVHHFRRNVSFDWPDNPLPIDPAERFFGRESGGLLPAQVFQNAGCSWRCWYCFVDDNLLSANPKGSEFLSASELLDIYQSEQGLPNVIDLSGGQPDLVPEFALWVADELVRRSLADRVFLWSDDNLSNDYLWRYLETEEIQRLASYTNYARVGCFKGFDDYSFSFNTRAAPHLFENQFSVARRLIESGISLYGYVTFTTDVSHDIAGKMRNFVDRLQSLVHPNFPLRMVPLRIQPFSPTRARAGTAFDSSLQIQHEVVAAWLEELNRRYSPAELEKPKFAHSLR